MRCSGTLAMAPGSANPPPRKIRSPVGGSGDGSAPNALRTMSLTRPVYPTVQEATGHHLGSPQQTSRGGKRKVWTATDDAVLMRLAHKGITKSDAARRLGCDHSTVSRRVIRLGIGWREPLPKVPSKPGSSRRSWTTADDEMLRRLSEAGWSHGMAALELDRDQSQRSEPEPDAQ